MTSGENENAWKKLEAEKYKRYRRQIQNMKKRKVFIGEDEKSYH